MEKLITFVLCCCFISSNGQWNAYSTVNNPICTGLSKSANSPDIAADGAGGYFIVWYQNNNTDTTRRGLFMQHINAAGNPLWNVNGKIVCHDFY